MRIIFLIFIISNFFQVSAQKLKKGDKDIIASLDLYSKTFSGGEFIEEGRNKKMAYFIGDQFKLNHLKSLKEGAFIQSHNVFIGKSVDTVASVFTVNGDKLILFEDYFPLPYSSNASIETFPNPAIKEDGVPWFIDLKDFLDKNNLWNSGVNADDAIINFANSIYAKGATGLIFYESELTDTPFKFNFQVNRKNALLPVIVIKHKAWKVYFKDHSASYDIKLQTKLSDNYREVMNVVGEIDNKADLTVVIATGYERDMLGSASQNLVNKTGVQDNNGGIAIFLELAKRLSTSSFSKFNYLFMAVSEDDGQFPESKQCYKNISTSGKNVNFLISIDINNGVKEKEVGITGINSSKQWVNILDVKKKEALKINFEPAYIAVSNIKNKLNVPSLQFVSTDRVKTSSLSEYEPDDITGLFLVTNKIIEIITKAQQLPKFEGN